jgi:hypothetical protein
MAPGTSFCHYDCEHRNNVHQLINTVMPRAVLLQSCDTRQQGGSQPLSIDSYDINGGSRLGWPTGLGPTVGLSQGTVSMYTLACKVDNTLRKVYAAGR